MHASVLIPLLRGSFEYKEAGILDKTHVRFFTLKSIIEMMGRNGFVIEAMYSNRAEEEQLHEEQELISQLIQLLGEDFKNQLLTYQYVIRARKN